MAAPSLPTPLYGHVGRGAFSDVYEPSEDTFLLLDALEAAAAELAGCEEGARHSGSERGVLRGGSRKSYPLREWWVGPLPGD